MTQSQVLIDFLKRWVRYYAKVTRKVLGNIVSFECPNRAYANVLTSSLCYHSLNWEQESDYIVISLRYTYTLYPWLSSGPRKLDLSNKFLLFRFYCWFRFIFSAVILLLFGVTGLFYLLIEGVLLYLSNSGIFLIPLFFYLISRHNL